MTNKPEDNYYNVSIGTRNGEPKMLWYTTKYFANIGAIRAWIAKSFNQDVLVEVYRQGKKYVDTFKVVDEKTTKSMDPA